MDYPTPLNGDQAGGRWPAADRSNGEPPNNGSAEAGDNKWIN